MKRNIIEIVFMLVVIIGIGFTFYDIFKLNESVSHNGRIIDSLKTEMNRYQFKYDSLQLVVTKLDSTVTNQEERVKIVKQSFYFFKTPIINDSDSATKYIKDFIRE
jgi:YD repeat-containing protein